MKIRLILFLVSIIFCAHEPLFSQYREPQKISNLKILSWNIFMLPYVSMFNGNGQRAKRIVEELKHSDYQLIVFQEAFSSKCRKILATGLKETYPYQYGPANKHHLPMRTNSGLWVVSKIPLQNRGEIAFKESEGFDKVARKGAVLFEGVFQQQRFQLVATHLQADNPWQIRQKQLGEIRDKLLLPNNISDIPQIICGDFNTDMDDSRNYSNMLVTLDARNGDLSGDVKTTYDEIDNTLAKIANGRKRIIDYVLVRNERFVECIERTIHTFVKPEATKKQFLSDHYAIEAEISFKPTAEAVMAQLEN